MTLAALLLLTAFQQAVQDDQCIKCHVDQGAEVKETMHQKAGVGCVSCHGTDEIVNEKHRRTAAFRPARAPQIASLCGSCHKGVLDAFQPSDHFAAAARDDGNAKHRSTCSACHEFHTTVKPDRIAILNRCLECHEKTSHEYKEGAEGFDSMEGFERTLNHLEKEMRRLDRRAGIRTSDLASSVEDGRGARTQLQITQHGLHWKRIKAEAAASADRATAAYNLLAERERRFGHRYFGLGIFLGLLGAAAALVARRARSLRKETAA